MHKYVYLIKMTFPANPSAPALPSSKAPAVATASGVMVVFCVTAFAFTSPLSLAVSADHPGTPVHRGAPPARSVLRGTSPSASELLGSPTPSTSALLGSPTPASAGLPGAPPLPSELRGTPASSRRPCRNVGTPPPPCPPDCGDPRPPRGGAARGGRCLEGGGRCALRRRLYLTQCIHQLVLESQLPPKNVNLIF